MELWEYCHLTNLGRHYSTLMASSLLPYLRVWAPALNNRSYDMAFSLPPKSKVNWNAYLKALERLDKSLMKQPNSNTNIRADYSLHTQTAVKLLRGLYNILRPGRFITSPVYGDRSWPSVSESITKNTVIREKLQETISQGAIFDSRLLKREAVSKLYELTTNNQVDHSIFLNQLLTLEYGLFRHL